MKILQTYVKSELEVKNSKFLAELFPCQNQTDARAIIKSQKQKYADASHVVHAFVIGLGAEILGSSDDGEPSGTAGRPTLDVLKGSDCTNVVLTITRWFGGTLLGTGGLVKAYSGAAKLVIEKAILEKAISEYIETKNFSFSADYSAYQGIKRIFCQFEITDLTEDFKENVFVCAKIKSTQIQDFSDKIKNLSNGKIQLTLL